MIKLTRYLLFLMPMTATACGLISSHAAAPDLLYRPEKSVQSYPIEIERPQPISVGDVPSMFVRAESVTEKSKLDYEMMAVIATAYCPCRRCCGPNAIGLTKTEISAWRPGIAVDPRVIRLGSVLVVPGYNNEKPAFADDIGGKIRGNRIDVRMTYHWQAKEWGTQTLVVKVWKPR
jgi:3D (Asp-Asp-Asp) domain-containing protein